MKPMKAVDAVMEKIQFPVLASVKLDGIRGAVRGGVVLSNSLKPLPNKKIQELFGKPEYEGFDGELIVGSPTAEDVYRKSNSKVMTKEGDAEDVTFFVFDLWNHEAPYEERLSRLKGLASNCASIQVLDSKLAKTLEEVTEIEEQAVTQGYEGLMLRKPDSPYKFGRSTVNQGYLLKIKRFSDAEAVIEDYVELMHNNNPKTVNELGHSQRSSHKKNKVPSGTMGTLVVTCLENGWSFEIGTGFTAEQRKEFWENKEKYLGAMVKYKYFPVGMKELPRHPVFLGLRDPIDRG